MLPNKMFVTMPDCREPMLANRIPSPLANARIVPVTTSRSPLRCPNAPMASPPPTHATSSPQIGLMNSNAASVAPGKPMWAIA